MFKIVLSLLLVYLGTITMGVNAAEYHPPTKVPADLLDMFDSRQNILVLSDGSVVQGRLEMTSSDSPTSPLIIDSNQNSYGMTVKNIDI